MVHFLVEHDVPGAALAVARNGRLVYARGFGYADRDAGRVVEPTSRFRIASISKPLTAVTILKLVEQGRLNLDDKVWSLLSLREPADQRWKSITIRDLLQHSGGWDRDESFDPMFRSVQIAEHCKIPPPAMPKHIIAYMLEQPLDFDPGTRYAYSNFGYCLLGRVIERITGKAYQTVVRQLLLKPLKMSRTRLGKTLPEFRAVGEVHYYPSKKGRVSSVFAEVDGRVPRPYGGWCLEAMDAHGGWISSAVDLVRFASALNKPKPSTILNAHCTELMIARPDYAKDEDGYYGCGWRLTFPDNGQGYTASHMGLLDGTSTLLVRRHDGFNWAVLFNKDRSPTGETLATLIDPRMHEVIDNIKQ